MRPSQTLLPRLGAFVRPAPSIPACMTVHPIQGFAVTCPFVGKPGSDGAEGWEGWWYPSKSIEVSIVAARAFFCSLSLSHPERGGQGFVILEEGRGLMRQKSPIQPMPSSPSSQQSVSPRISPSSPSSRNPPSATVSEQRRTGPRKSEESSVPAPTLAWNDFLSMV